MALKKVLDIASPTGDYDLSSMLATSNPGAKAIFQIVTDSDPQTLAFQGRLSSSESWVTLLETSLPGLYELPMFPLMQIYVGDTGSDSAVYMWT